MIARRLSEPPPSVRRIRPYAGAAVDRALTTALAPIAADRFQTAGGFAAALETAARAEPDPGQGRRATRVRWAVLGALVLLTVGGYAFWRYGADTWAPATPVPGVAAPEPAPDVGPSVAVLPFTNLSPDRENEYFSDGMTEELITALGKIEGLRVAARTSAFAFKGTMADIREIGAKLNVGAVLEGSVRRAGRRLRLTAQLVSVADGYHLWSEEYDRELKDAFALQDELARAIVSALRVRLQRPGPVAGPLIEAATADPEAHDLYLRGRFLWNQRTYQSLSAAVGYFERAIGRDSAYAEAYAGLADTWVLFPTYAVSPPGKAFPLAREAALRALALDSTLGSAHAALALVREQYEWDWAGAEREFRRAIALEPGYATAHQWYAEYLSAMGKGNQAMVEADRAVALDPLSPVIRVDRAGALIRSRHYDEAIAQLRGTLELVPEFLPTRNFLGWAYLAKGMTAEALPELEAAVQLSGGRYARGRLAHAYALAGRRDTALALLGHQRELYEREYASPYSMVLGYTGLDDHQRALEWLERAADQHDPNIALNLLTDPLLDRLRPNPRFKGLLRRMGLS
jgi:TolB-like protein/Tfp pilus assembly protein PilF